MNSFFTLKHLGFLLLFGGSFLAVASDEKVEMITIDLIPYGYVDDKGSYKGALYDVMNEIMNQSQIGRTNMIVPPKRILAMRENGDANCLIAVNSANMVKLFDLVEPIDYWLNAGVIPKAYININSFDDLKSLLIAMPRGTYFNERFHTDETITKVFTTKYLHAIEMLKRNRVDAVAGAIESLMFIAEQQGMSAENFDEPFVMNKHNMYLQCAPSVSAAAKAKLKQAVVALKAKGTIEKIIQRYIGQSAATFNPD